MGCTVMSWEDEIVMRDVKDAGVVVSDRVGDEISSQLDFEEDYREVFFNFDPWTMFLVSDCMYVLFGTVSVSPFSWGRGSE